MDHLGAIAKTQAERREALKERRAFAEEIADGQAASLAASLVPHTMRVYRREGADAAFLARVASSAQEQVGPILEHVCQKSSTLPDEG